MISVHFPSDLTKLLPILFSKCSISLLNLIVFVTAHDTYSFLTLNNQLQIHENTIEIGLNLKVSNARSTRSSLDHNTYVSHWKDKIVTKYITKSLTFHIFESVFKPPTSSFLSNHQHFVTLSNQSDF